MDPIKITPFEESISIMIMVFTTLVSLFIGYRYWSSNTLKKKGSPASEWRLRKWIAPREYIKYQELKDNIINLNNGKRNINEDDSKRLRDALLKRAIAVIPIIFDIQAEGEASQSVLNNTINTSRTNKELQTLKEKKSFVDSEMELIRIEADILMEGWGAQIFAQSLRLHKALEQHKADEIKKDK